MNKTNNAMEYLTFKFFVNQRHLVVKLRIISSTVLRLDGSHSISVVDLDVANIVLLGNDEQRIKEYHVNFFTSERMLNSCNGSLL